MLNILNQQYKQNSEPEGTVSVRKNKLAGEPL